MKNEMSQVLPEVQAVEKTDTACNSHWAGVLQRSEFGSFARQNTIPRSHDKLSRDQDGLAHGSLWNSAVLRPNVANLLNRHLFQPIWGLAQLSKSQGRVEGGRCRNEASITRSRCSVPDFYLHVLRKGLSQPDLCIYLGETESIDNSLIICETKFQSRYPFIQDSIYRSRPFYYLAQIYYHALRQTFRRVCTSTSSRRAVFIVN